MPGHQKSNWLLVFAIFGMVGPTALWAADKQANGSVVVPVSSTTSARTGEVVPAGYVAPTDLRNNIIDHCEDLRLTGPTLPVNTPRRTRLGRCLQQTEARIKYNEDKMVRWFYFIHGYGPANWQFP